MIETYDNKKGHKFYNNFVIARFSDFWNFEILILHSTSVCYYFWYRDWSWRKHIKNRQPMFLRKRLFFKVSQSSGQSICVGGFVSKVAGLLQPATLSKKWLQHRFFCVILQRFYKHNFSENLPGTASKGSSYFVFKHKVDLRHCKEMKHFHNTHKNVPLKTN